jgi:glyoxylase-like metal-dependent hydrolase (beta-lactamase superfamily II)
MQHPGISVGRFEIEVVCEGFAAMSLADEVPDRPVDWDRERARHGWAFHGADAWQWHVHAFLVRTPVGVVLIDAGVGAFGPYRPWTESVPDAWAGVDAGSVDHVVMTHLHADHAGGGVVEGSPRFPNAVYHVHIGDWLHFGAEEKIGGYHARAALAVVEEMGMLSLGGLDGEIVPGVEVRHMPGHTPGHRGVVIRDGGDGLLIAGDLLHLPVQVEHPEWPSSHDDDPAIGSASRRLALWRAQQEGWWVAAGHFARPFGRPGEDGWHLDGHGVGSD